jgi:hypothetical protein
MSSAAEKTSLRQRTAPPTVRLQVWPLRDEPVRSGALIGLLGMIALISGISSSSVAAGVFVFGLLCLTIRRLWVPVTYEFGPKGLVQTTWGSRRRIIWSEVASYELFPDGVTISPVKAKSPGAILNGIFIRFNHQREELLGAIDFYIHFPAANAPSTTRTLTNPGAPLSP